MRTTSRASVTVEVERPEPDLQGRRGGRVREEHGRQADDHRRPDRVRRLRPADPEREHGRLREGRPEGKDGRVARRQWTEHRRNRVAAPADGAQPARRSTRVPPPSSRRRRASHSAAAQAPAAATPAATPQPAAGDGIRRIRNCGGVRGSVDAARRRRPRDADRAAEAAGVAGRSTPAISRPCSATTSPWHPPSRRRTSSSSSSSAGPDTKYAALKEAASKREPLPHFALKNVKITVNVDADYSIVEHSSDAQRRRDRRGKRSKAEGHLRALRCPLRPHRIHGQHACRRARRPGRRRRRRWRGRMRGADARHSEAGRRHQQRRGRRWIGDGVGDGGGACVRAGTEAEAIGDVRVALRRGVGALRLALHGGLPDRAARQGVGAAEHRHDRPQPLRRAVRVEHGVPGRIRSHQHRAAQPERGHEQGTVRAAQAGLRATTIRRTPSRSTRAAITTATRRRAFRSFSTRPGCTRTTTT